MSSPWIQAGRLAFLALYAVTVLAALAWSFSNVRQIDPQNRAVVLHFGALDRIQNAGLLLAWPRPFEQVILLPAADRVIERRVTNLLRSDAALQADRSATFASPISDALAGSGYLLTGDAGVVQLDVRVFYKVTEPYAFVLQGEHVLPALDRLVTRSAVALTAARDLDTILVARPELIGADSQAAARRERLRGDLVQGISDIPTRNSLYVLRAVETRANLLRATTLLEGAALDKYSFTRDLYLNRRQSQVDDMIDKGIGLGDGE